MRPDLGQLIFGRLATAGYHFDEWFGAQLGRWGCGWLGRWRQRCLRQKGCRQTQAVSARAAACSAESGAGQPLAGLAPAGVAVQSVPQSPRAIALALPLTGAMSPAELPVALALRSWKAVLSPLLSAGALPRSPGVSVHPWERGEHSCSASLQPLVGARSPSLPARAGLRADGVESGWVHAGIQSYLFCSDSCVSTSAPDVAGTKAPLTQPGVCSRGRRVLEGVLNNSSPTVPRTSFTSSWLGQDVLPREAGERVWPSSSRSRLSSPSARGPGSHVGVSKQKGGRAQKLLAPASGSYQR